MFVSVFFTRAKLGMTAGMVLFLTMFLVNFMINGTKII